MASAAASILGTAARLLGATALLGLPLLAVAWPNKQLQHWDPAKAAAARSEPRITIVRQDEQQQQQNGMSIRGQPVNAVLSQAEMQVRGLFCS